MENKVEKKENREMSCEKKESVDKTYHVTCELDGDELEHALFLYALDVVRGRVSRGCKGAVAFVFRVPRMPRARLRDYLRREICSPLLVADVRHA